MLIQSAKFKALAGTVIVLVLCLLSGLWVREARSEHISPQDALGEFNKLKRHLAVAWANLEWTVRVGEVDFAALNTQTEQRLLKVQTVRDARKVLREFLAALQDPHLIVWESTSSGSIARKTRAPSLTRETSARTACRSLGFRKRDLGFKLRFSRSSGYISVRSDDPNPFFAGILPLADGRRAGFLRIAHFGDDGYPDVCRETWSIYRESLDKPCRDGWCAGFRTVLRDRLLYYLEQRIRALQELEYDVLVVDITGNGGGNEWANNAAQIISQQPLKCSSQAFVGHVHWRRILEQMRETVLDDLLRDDVPDHTMTLLETAARNLESMIRETNATCDMTPIWSGKDLSANCTNLVKGAFYSCGLFDYVQAPEMLKGASRPELLYQPFRNRFQASVNDNPVAVLVDSSTASASEDFASLLQDNDAAIVIGDKTYGAGCGFVNGGITLNLEKVGFKVKAPDCARYRRDGTNEVAGIKPNIDLGWADDSSRVRTEKVLDALVGMHF